MLEIYMSTSWLCFITLSLSPYRKGHLSIFSCTLPHIVEESITLSMYHWSELFFEMNHRHIDWAHWPKLAPVSLPKSLETCAEGTTWQTLPPYCSCLHHSPAFPHLSLKNWIKWKRLGEKRYYLFLMDIASYQRPAWMCRELLYAAARRVGGKTKMVWTDIKDSDHVGPLYRPSYFTLQVIQPFLNTL